MKEKSELTKTNLIEAFKQENDYSMPPAVAMRVLPEEISNSTFKQNKSNKLEFYRDIMSGKRLQKMLDG
jgi:hypothetical protein